MKFTSFTKLNSGQYFRLGKNEFSELLARRMIPISSASALDLVPVGADFLRLVSGGNINMVADCYGWSQVLSTRCNSFSDWCFYLLMLHSYLNYNNFYCGYNFDLALLVCYNKIYILIHWVIYWDQCSINDLKQKDLYIDFLGWVQHLAIYIC